VAFVDGQFAGPDSLCAFNRLAIERDAEIALLDEVKNGRDPNMLLKQALEAPSNLRDHALIARKVLARTATGWLGNVRD